MQQNLYKRGIAFALILIVICFGFSATGSTEQDDLQVVKLQLRWDNQFQFAGYYAADWLGFYAEEGIKVEIIPAIKSDQSIVSSVKEVSEGRADFGIGSSDILIANDRGADLRVVAVIMQRSAARYFLKKETPYSKLSDLLDLKVARNVNDLIDIELQAMLINEGIDPNLIKAYPHQAGIDNLMSDKIQVMPGYELGTPYIAQQKGIPVKEINPQEYGVDFYGDSLFSSGNLVDQNPGLVEKFKRASIKGWEYAFNNSEEIATRISPDLINYEKYSDLLDYNMYQAQIMKELAEYPIIDAGHINPYRWQKMSTFLKSVGLIENEADIDKLIFDPVKLIIEKEKQRSDMLISLALFAFGLLILIGVWIFLLNRAIKRKTGEIFNVQSNLVDSERKYKLITDNASDVISVFNMAKMKFTYISPSISALRGLTVEEALNEDIIDSIAPEFAEFAKDTMGKSVEEFQNNPETFNNFISIMKQSVKNGDFIWVEISTRFRYNSEEELEAINVSRNVDERKKIEDKISNDENRFRNVLQNLDAGIVVHATDTTIIDCNKRAEELLGLSREQLLGKTAIDPRWMFLSEDGTQLPLEEFPVVHILNSKNPIKGQVLGVYQPNINSTVWLAVNGTLIYNHMGEITEAVISFINITDRKKAEDSLNEQMKDLLDSQRIAHLGTWRLTLATNEVVWSEELYKMYECDPLLPVPPYTEHKKLYSQKSWDMLSVSLERTRTTGVPYTLELETIKKDGSKGWMWVHGEVERDMQGNILFLRGAAQDITIGKQAEDKLAFLNQRLELILSSTDEGLVGLDVQGNHTFINSAAAKMFGYASGELIGCPSHSIWHHSNPDGSPYPIDECKIHKACILGQSIKVSTEVFWKKDGTSFPVEYSSTPVYEQDQLIGSVITFSDITERIQASETLRESEENHRLLITEMQQGLAVHDIILDESGKPVDYRFVNVNKAFELQTGLRREDILGRTVKEALPGIEPYWIEKYGHVALTGEPLHYENHAKELGRHFEVTAYSPQKGRFAVIVSDITERILAQERVLRLSYHDELTGLYNRRFYDEELLRLDTARNMPLSFIIGDVNGLKLINDSFGHTKGDELLRTVAAVLKKECRADDILARLSGDEFAILLPRTDTDEAERVVHRFQMSIGKEHIGLMEVSVAFGTATQHGIEEAFETTFKAAEDAMYRNKVYESQSTQNRTVSLIMTSLLENNYREKQHSQRVSDFVVNLARGMGQSDSEVSRIRLAGLMHDIGKIGLREALLNKEGKLTDEERKEMQNHPEIGHRILSSVNDFSEISDYILQHHEWWDGTGYPKGLKGLEISLPARMISVVDAFDAMTSERTYRKVRSREDAIKVLRQCSGTQFDPAIVRKFTAMLENGETENELNANGIDTSPLHGDSLEIVGLKMRRKPPQAD